MRAPALTPLALLVTVLACGGQDEGVELRSSALEIESGALDDDGIDVVTPIAGAPKGSIIYLGLVEPQRVAEVSWTVPGTIATVHVAVGDTVREGQVLAELATEAREIKLEETRKRWQDARASRPSAVARSVDGPPPDWVIDEAKRIQEDAERDAAHLKSDLARVKQRGKTDGQEGAAELAMAIHRARTERPSTVAVHRANEDALAVALVDDIEQRLRQLENAISNSRLTSPLAGMVIGRAANPGEEWNTRSVTPAFQIVDPASFVVTVVLPVERARRLNLGEDIWVELAGDRGAPPIVLRAGFLQNSTEAVTMVGRSGGRVAWTNATFKLPGQLPRRVFIGEEVRVAVAP